MGESANVPTPKPLAGVNSPNALPDGVEPSAKKLKIFAL